VSFVQSREAAILVTAAGQQEIRCRHAAFRQLARDDPRPSTPAIVGAGGRADRRSTLGGTDGGDAVLEAVALGIADTRIRRALLAERTLGIRLCGRAPAGCG
jgi:hypothetical protein